MSKPEGQVAAGSKAGRILKIVAFPAIILGLVLVAVLNAGTLFEVFSDRDALFAAMEAAGWQAPFFYILAQIVQVFVFIIPGDVVQFAGGYLFGFWGGLGLSLLGISLGSILNFGLARWLGRSFVETLFKKETVDSMEDFLASPRFQVVFFLLFAIPGLPGKDLLCYVAGISRLKPLAFLGITMTARIPGLVGSSLLGSSVSAGDTLVAIIVGILVAVCFLTGLIFQKKIRAWIDKLAKPGQDARAADPGAGAAEQAATAGTATTAAKPAASKTDEHK